MLTEIKPFLDWFHAHPEWAGIVMFFVAFTECLAVVGLIIPGTVIMTAVGTMIGAGILPFVSITLWAIAGALAGDILSYWFGYHYHHRIREIWPFRRYPHLLKSGELFFKRHGGKSIFIGRFAGPMRAILPLIAGMMSMPPKRFLFADILSAIAWAPGYMLPGILIGYASKQLPPEIATRIIIFIIAALLLFWCVSWLLKRLYAAVMSILDRLLAKHWQTLQKYSLIKQILQDPASPEHHSQFTLAILFFISLLFFATLTYSVIHHGMLTTWNHPIYYFMRSLRNTFLDPIMVGVTLITPTVLQFMWLCVLIWLAIKRNWWAAAHWLAVGIISPVLGELIKLWIHSPRPTGLLQTPRGFSYPSGHSLSSVTYFGFLAVLLTHGRSSLWQKIAFSLVTLIAGSIVFSRLYLGAHWLTDVVGGIVLGIAIISAATVSYRRKKMQPIAPLGMLIVVIASLAIGWTGSFLHGNKRALHNYTPTWEIKKIESKKWWEHAGENEPLYRTNRFGKSIQIINVQWAGHLSKIERALQRQGWTILPKPSLVLMLGELNKKHNGRRLPLLSQFYEDRKPVLVMFKFIDQPKKAVMLLRLWDAHLILDNGQPLWLGSINYHKPWHTRFLNHEPEAIENESQLPLATDLFVQDLKGFEWKKINYPRSVILALAIDKEWDGNVLMVRSISKASSQ